MSITAPDAIVALAKVVHASTVYTFADPASNSGFELILRTGVGVILLKPLPPVIGSLTFTQSDCPLVSSATPALIASASIVPTSDTSHAGWVLVTITDAAGAAAEGDFQVLVMRPLLEVQGVEEARWRGSIPRHSPKKERFSLTINNNGYYPSQDRTNERDPGFFGQQRLITLNKDVAGRPNAVGIVQGQSAEPCMMTFHLKQVDSSLPTNIAGRCNAVAIIKYGVGGTASVLEVSFKQGTSLTVPATFWDIQAFIETGFDDIGMIVPYEGGTIIASCSIGIGPRSGGGVQPSRDYSLFVLHGGDESPRPAEIAIPAHASVVRIFAPTHQLLTTTSIQLIGNSTTTISTNNGTYIEVPISLDQYLVRIFNGSTSVDAAYIASFPILV